MAMLFDTKQEKFVLAVEESKDGKIFINGEHVRAYVSTYTSIGGPKAVLMAWDDEMGFYEPWNTWYPAKDMDGAWKDALSWAQAEEIPAIRNAA